MLKSQIIQLERQVCDILVSLHGVDKCHIAALSVFMLY